MPTSPTKWETEVKKKKKNKDFIKITNRSEVHQLAGIARAPLSSSTDRYLNWYETKGFSEPVLVLLH